jgi:hypothetical protein
LTSRTLFISLAAVNTIKIPHYCPYIMGSYYSLFQFFAYKLLKQNRGIPIP